jgi:NADH-quinone oxidoreductase subunit J
MILLLCTLALLSVLAVELDDLLYSVICLCCMGILLGVVFLMLNAQAVAFFQLLIYSGAITILLFSLVNLTEEKGGARLPFPRIRGIEVPTILLTIALLIAFVQLAGFLPDKLAVPRDDLSVWIWERRLSDTMLQAFLLFTSLVGILVVWSR